VISNLRSQSTAFYFSFFLSFFICCQRWTVATSIIRKGLLERVSCDLHSYPVALFRFLLCFISSERKRIPSDYTSSSGSYIHIFFHICNICTCTHKSTRLLPTLLSDVAIIRAIVMYHRHANSNAAASFCSALSRLTAKLSMITS